jgi:hypothetical protein
MVFTIRNSKYIGTAIQLTAFHGHLSYLFRFNSTKNSKSLNQPIHLKYDKVDGVPGQKKLKAGVRY